MTTIPELIDREAAATVLRMEYPNSDLKSEIKAAICNVLLQLPSKPLLHADLEMNYPGHAEVLKNYQEIGL